MPELPEVETVVRDLRPLLAGRTILGLQLGKHSLRKPWRTAWNANIVGAAIGSITRRGKWILLDLEARGALLVHLGMTGQFTVASAKEPRSDHTHFVFTLSDTSELRFRDVRRFGSFEWFAEMEAIHLVLNDKLGPEPFEIPARAFREAIRNAKRTLKAILLDQSIVAGVGNIYADESLHRAKLHPEMRGNELTSAQCDRLRKSIEIVIAKAIEGRGSTIRDYVGGSGLKGEFQNEFAVYGRTGEPCPRCRTPIAMVRVSGRSSHFCPKCQQRS
jgi:formamidopyrimidine-DNA glycosylase